MAISTGKSRAGFRTSETIPVPSRAGRERRRRSLDAKARRGIRTAIASELLGPSTSDALEPKRLEGAFVLGLDRHRLHFNRFPDALMQVGTDEYLVRAGTSAEPRGTIYRITQNCVFQELIGSNEAVKHLAAVDANPCFEDRLFPSSTGLAH